MFCEIFQINFIVKHLRVNTTGTVLLQVVTRFYLCSERISSIYPSKFGQLPLHSSTTTIIIWLTKQISCPEKQVSCPEENRNIARFLENLCDGVLFDKVIW